MNKTNQIIKWRAYFVLTVLFLVAFLLIYRLYTVQIIHGESFAERAERQYMIPSTQVFDRGNIYFTYRNGQRMAAATLKSGYKIILNPSLINNPESVYNNLSMEFEIDPDDFLSKVSNQNRRHVELKKRADRNLADSIIAKNLIGVNLHHEKWRYYPGNSLAAHLVGFVSHHEDLLRGQYGLERQYENILNREGDDIFQNFFVEIFSNVRRIIVDGEDMKGSIVTTIEPNVQMFLENELRKVSEDFSTSLAGGIIMDPQTGKIYSMALHPTFDLNNFNFVSNPSVFRNHLVESVYEFGSVMKALTIAIGIEEGQITPESTYNDTGSKTLDGRTIRNHDLKAHGVVNMQTVLNDSLNLGVAEIVNRVGREFFANYMKRLFSPLTKIDLPNEQSSLISNLNSRNSIEFATASFGQGIAMTPISMTRALSALGNGGYLVQPHIVSEISYRSGLSKKMNFERKERIFSKETSETISRMLVNTVDEALLGGSVALNNYNIAAKTGTAQIAKTHESGYYDDRFLHSFFGYFPAYEPEFIIFLYIIDPQNTRFASQTLTHPFMSIVEFLINYYEIPPDRDSDLALN